LTIKVASLARATVIGEVVCLIAISEKVDTS